MKSAKSIGKNTANSHGKTRLTKKIKDSLPIINKMSLKVIFKATLIRQRIKITQSKDKQANYNSPSALLKLKASFVMG